MINIGACWFDDISVAQGGWSSVNGSPAKRIGSYSELKTNVIWVTNLTYPAYRKLNLTKSPHIYDGQYFRTSIRLLAAEMGLLENPRAAVEFCSTVFTRVAGLGKSQFGIGMENPGYRYTSIIASQVTPDFMRKRIDSYNEMDINEAIRQSTQANQAMTGIRPHKGSSIHPFIIPRGAHARWLMSLSYPGSDPWEELKRKHNEAVFGVEDGVQIKGTKGVIEKLLKIGSENAVLLRVNVLNTSPRYRSFATFSAGADYPRRWATLPEVLDMSRYSKIEISGGYQTKLAKLPFLDKIDIDDSEFSYSRSLFYENFWTALASPLYGNKNFTAVGAYMRAYDRLACLRVAEKFNSHQYMIGSFGVGRVMVYLNRQEEKNAALFALNNNIIPPMHMIHEDDDN